VNQPKIKRDADKQGFAIDQALRHGRRNEALRKEIAALSVRELNDLANRTAIRACELRALCWERSWSVPTGN
jgi:hypothetical protein